MSGPSLAAPPPSAGTRVVELAPAKINLALHVTGRRADGYHILDSLVAFARADAADRLSFEAAERITLEIGGPFAAAVPAGPDNLVLRAAETLAELAAGGSGRRPGARIVLEKNLPVAAGIGGGSADAAAALRGLDRLWRLGLGPARLAALGLALGADVPVCLVSRPARMGGIGELVEPLPDVLGAGLVLVNPLAPVSTREVFDRLESRDNAPMPPIPADLGAPGTLAAFLAATRNDLEAAARALQPAIAEVATRLEREPECRFVRMSGAGATCFGLFAGVEAAASAARRIAGEQPGWWVRAVAV